MLFSLLVFLCLISLGSTQSCTTSITDCDCPDVDVSQAFFQRVTGFVGPPIITVLANGIMSDTCNGLPMDNITSNFMGSLQKKLDISKYGQLLTVMSNMDKCMKPDKCLPMLSKVGESFKRVLEPKRAELYQNCKAAKGDKIAFAYSYVCKKQWVNEATVVAVMNDVYKTIGVKNYDCSKTNANQLVRFTQYKIPS